MTPGTNGRAPARGDPPAPPEVGEALRDAQDDAAAKANRLVAVPRPSGEQKAALRTVPGSLRHRIPGGEETR